jgi:hypothetical protein
VLAKDDGGGAEVFSHSVLLDFYFSGMVGSKQVWHGYQPESSLYLSE